MLCPLYYRMHLVSTINTLLLNRARHNFDGLLMSCNILLRIGFLSELYVLRIMQYLRKGGKY